MPEKDAIVEEIRTALDGLFDRPGRREWKGGDWTREVQFALCRAGWKCGATVCCAKGGRKDRLPANFGEWLYDVTCLVSGGHETQDEAFLRNREILFVAEVALNDNRDGILGDFIKLPLARTAVRVMVYDKARLKASFDQGFCMCVREHVGTEKGDRYLFAARTSTGFEYHQIDYPNFA